MHTSVAILAQAQVRIHKDTWAELRYHEAPAAAVSHQCIIRTAGYLYRQAARDLPAGDPCVDVLRNAVSELGCIVRPSPPQDLTTNMQKAPAHVPPLLGVLAALAGAASSHAPCTPPALTRSRSLSLLLRLPRGLASWTPSRFVSMKSARDIGWNRSHLSEAYRQSLRLRRLLGVPNYSRGRITLTLPRATATRTRRGFRRLRQVLLLLVLRRRLPRPPRARPRDPGDGGLVLLRSVLGCGARPPHAAAGARGR